MQCPVCSAALKITERHSIEIDYCPQCRGVWLDRGELDKLIERASTVVSRRSYDDDDDDEEFSDRGREAERHYGRKGRRRSFLSELFNFD